MFLYMIRAKGGSLEAPPPHSPPSSEAINAASKEVPGNRSWIYVEIWHL